MGKDLKGKDLGKGISQRRDGTYEARYVNKFGKRTSIYDKDLRALKKKLAIATADNIKGLVVKNDTMTISEWFPMWMNAYKDAFIRPSTKHNYTHAFRKHIEPYLGDIKFNQLTRMQCNQYMKTMKDLGYSWETINSARILIIDMYDKGMQDDYALKNPMRGVHIPMTKPEEERRVLTREEQAIFFECSAGTFYNNLYVVAVNSGLRPGELFALTEQDIDFQHKKINVDKTLLYQKLEGDTQKTFHLGPPKTKNSKRKVPMNAACELALRKQIRLKKVIAQKNVKQHEFSDRLFVTSFNTPLNSQIYMDSIKKILKEINICVTSLEQIKPFSGHTFRHTFATRAIEAGIQPKTLQKYLGHASLKMTMDLYVHVTDETQDEEIKKIDNSFKEIIETKNAENYVA